MEAGEGKRRRVEGREIIKPARKEEGEKKGEGTDVVVANELGDTLS